MPAMRVSRAGAVAVAAVLAGSGSGSGCAAFNLSPSPLRAEGIPRPRSARKSSASVHEQCRSAFAQSRCRSRRCTSSSSSSSSSLCAGKSDPEESSQAQWSDVNGSAPLQSRRAALRQCSSVFAAAFASSSSISRPDGASASEFSDGPEPPEELPPPVQKDAPPQFSDETVITPRPPVAQQEASPRPESPVSQVTLENSRVVQIPVASQAGPTTPTSFSSTATTTAQPKPKDDGKKRSPEQVKGSVGAMANIVATSVALGATGVAVLGRVSPNTDALSGKAKVVMITPEPYGTDVGRRFYNGVDITVNDPIPASDVRRYCDAGEVKPECTDTITGFLGQVGTNAEKGVDVPTEQQQETANAVLSYLDSLASSAAASARASTDTAAAFSSYLNGLSSGEISAPSSPQLVADYLSSLNDVQNRMSTLESNMQRMPGEFTGRLQEWQEGQDERLAKEFIKIENHLMKTDGDDNCGFEGEQVPTVDMNGMVNGGTLPGKKEAWT